MATDYPSFTVVQLREQFKLRGIPTTGLTRKQQLIDRLLEEDANQTQSNPAIESDNEPVEYADADGPDSSNVDVPSAQPVEATNVQEAEVHARSNTEDPNHKQESALEHQPADPPEQNHASPHLDQIPAESVEPTAQSEQNAVGNDTIDEATEKHHSTSAKLHETVDSQESEALANDAIQSTTTSTNTSPPPPVLPEETRKRKRRSGTPPPYEEEIAQKKAKQQEDGEQVILQEDISAEPVAQTQDSQPQPKGPTVAHEQEKRLPDLIFPQASSSTVENLQNSAGDAQLHADADDEQSVAPAIHPATCALYIRNLKRPLRPDVVRTHLEALARPPRKLTSDSHHDSTDQDMVPRFFLDPIRTHCFAVFISVAAASRVRSALHDQIWPPEGTREPLWVDFVPEESVQGWIDIETKAAGTGGSRGAGAHRWEVQYDRLYNGSTIAKLHDAMTGVSAVPDISGPKRSTDQSYPAASDRAQPNAMISHQTQRGASAPRNAPEDKPASFVALDTLFKSTQAKPKLYFLPVDSALAEHRLRELDSLSSKTNEVPSGGSGHPDSHRYTFEDGILVDNGPEFGLREQRRRPRGFRGGR